MRDIKTQIQSHMKIITNLKHELKKKDQEIQERSIMKERQSVLEKENKNSSRRVAKVDS